MATEGGGEEAARAQFTMVELLPRRVLTIIFSQKEQSGVSSAASA